MAIHTYTGDSLRRDDQGKKSEMKRPHVMAVALILIMSAPACSSAPASVAPPTHIAIPTAVGAHEVIVYASDLPQSALSELTFYDDPASPGGKVIGLPNTGDKLNAPPEDDPHVAFTVPIQGNMAYRCWIHMKVGAPKGVSQANVFYVQFSDAVDKANQVVYTLGTDSYLTAHGPEKQGWMWVGCDASDPASPESLIYFRANGKVTVRLQAGMEGVGFDQVLLSPARFLNQPPSEAVVQKERTKNGKDFRKRLAFSRSERQRLENKT
jgi:hypothetical protein